MLFLFQIYSWLLQWLCRPATRNNLFWLTGTISFEYEGLYKRLLAINSITFTLTSNWTALLGMFDIQNNVGIFHFNFDKQKMYVARYFDIKCLKEKWCKPIYSLYRFLSCCNKFGFQPISLSKKDYWLPKDLCEHISLQKDFAFTMKTLINNNGWF